MINYDEYNWEDCEFGKAYCDAIYNFCKHRSFKKGLEIGLNSGSSALAFLTACPEATLMSVDISEWPDAILLLNKHGVGNRLAGITADSRIEMPRMIDAGLLFDFIYIDGDHLYDVVKSDLKNAVKLLAKGGVIAVDDCVEGHAHFGVWQAVQEICEEEGLIKSDLPGMASHGGIILVK